MDHLGNKKSEKTQTAEQARYQKASGVICHVAKRYIFFSRAKGSKGGVG
jgi:hypothetical protein